MKFERWFYFSVIPEWKDYYINYLYLISQIELIRSNVIDLAYSYARVQALTNVCVSEKIVNLDRIREEKNLWNYLDSSLGNVDNFYDILLCQFAERFHILTYQAIQLGLIGSFEPNKGCSLTRLEREFGRLSLAGGIGLEGMCGERRRRRSNLVALNPLSKISSVLLQLKDNMFSFGDGDGMGEGALEGKVARFFLDEEGGDLRDESEQRDLESEFSEANLEPEFEEEEVEGMAGMHASRIVLRDPNFNEESEDMMKMDDDENNGEQENRELEEGVLKRSSSSSYLKKGEDEVSDDSGYATSRSGEGFEDVKDEGQELNADLRHPLVSDTLLRSSSIMVINEGYEPKKGEGSRPMADEGLEGEKVPELNIVEFEGNDGKIDEKDANVALEIEEEGEESQMFVRRQNGIMHGIRRALKWVFGRFYANFIDGWRVVGPEPRDDRDEMVRLNEYSTRMDEGDERKRTGVKYMDGGSCRTAFGPLTDVDEKGRKDGGKNVKTVLSDAFVELYRGLHLLKSFSSLNVLAVDNVMKKHDENIYRGSRRRLYREVLPKYNFFKHRGLKDLIRETEYVYSVIFTNGRRSEAMDRLRVPKGERGHCMATFRFGVLFGVSIGLILLAIYYCMLNGESLWRMRPGFIIFRMLALATLMFFYWGVDMYIWSIMRVNYVFIFEFNLRKHIHYQNVFDVSSIFTIILSSMVMLYVLAAFQKFGNHHVYGLSWLESIPLEVFPLVLIIMALALFTFHSIKSNFWLVKTLFRIVTAPFHEVLFKDFFLGDQLVSISIVLLDIDYTLCFFFTHAFRDGKDECSTNHIWVLAVLSLLPQIWRFLQSIRRYHDGYGTTQLYNSFKYMTGVFVALLSSLRIIFESSSICKTLWLISIIIATIYSYYWDVYKDWSLGNSKSKNRFLRDSLLYPTWWYYVAIFFNLVLRLVWTLTISPQFIFLERDITTTVFSVLEITRRAMWNVFRLENEQLNNCDNFRALKDLPLPLPLNPEAENDLFSLKIN